MRTTATATGTIAPAAPDPSRPSARPAPACGPASAGALAGALVGVVRGARRYRGYTGCSPALACLHTGQQGAGAGLQQGCRPLRAGIFGGKWGLTTPEAIKPAAAGRGPGSRQAVCKAPNQMRSVRRALCKHAHGRPVLNQPMCINALMSAFALLPLAERRGCPSSPACFLALRLVHAPSPAFPPRFVA